MSFVCVVTGAGDDIGKCVKWMVMRTRMVKGGES